MKLIAGLGNPGSAYTYTRHNVGFLTIDQIAEELGVKVDRLKYKALHARVRVGGEEVLLVKPQTYMNLSGQAIREFVSFYKLPPEDILIIFDDIDIEFASLRFRKSGSAGTHNGMKSVLYELGTDKMNRLKIGVGHKPPAYDLADFVLSKFRTDEKDAIERTILAARDCALTFVREGADRAMNRYNGTVLSD